MKKFHVIIPARYHSTRLPAKPLAMIGNKPMIAHVCDRASQSGAASVTVATDNQKIVDAVNQAGYSAVLTREDHPSGSDRLYEAAEIIGLKDEDIIVNVQGDEPFIPSENIAQVASLLDSDEQTVADTCQMSTLCCEINDADEVLDANAVKVIFDNRGKAIYFSRSVIPFNRDDLIESGKPLSAKYYRHIGIYAYTKGFLGEFIRWPQGALEKTESLEQLRVMENGYPIKIACLSERPPHGVDTQGDLEMARRHYASIRF